MSNLWSLSEVPTLRCFLHHSLFFRLKSIDLMCMKKLDTKVNIIPIIAKADTISKTELQKFKVWSPLSPSSTFVDLEKYLSLIPC